MQLFEGGPLYRTFYKITAVVLKQLYIFLLDP